MQRTIFERIFNSTLEGILVADERGKIILVNPALEKMFGYKRGELLGKTVEKLIPAKHTKAHKEHRSEYQKKPSKRRMGQGMNLAAKHQDGSQFPVEISLNHIKEPEGVLVLAHVMNISKRKEMEIALQELNVKLEKKVEDRTMDLENAILELQKINQDLASEVEARLRAESQTREALENERELGELKSRFVTMASHEFRTPLSTILSSNSLVAKYTETGDIEKQEKHIDRINGAVKNMIEILNDFLSLDKLEEGRMEARPERIKLEETLEEILSEMEPNLKTGQSTELSRSGKRSAIMVDRSMLKHIIVNLVSNAIKYSPDGATIHLTCKYEPKTVLISVCDEGMGIPEADQKHLFERFFRAKNAINIQGTGLGLNIVKKYVDLLGGKITYKSVLETGSTFTVKIPLKQ